MEGTKTLSYDYPWQSRIFFLGFIPNFTDLDPNLMSFNS
jgi:hypothetical protein